MGYIHVMQGGPFGMTVALKSPGGRKSQREDAAGVRSRYQQRTRKQPAKNE